MRRAVSACGGATAMVPVRSGAAVALGWLVGGMCLLRDGCPHPPFGPLPPQAGEGRGSRNRERNKQGIREAGNSRSRRQQVRNSRRREASKHVSQQAGTLQCRKGHRSGPMRSTPCVNASVSMQGGQTRREGRKEKRGRQKRIRKNKEKLGRQQADEAEIRSGRAGVNA